ncbi:hypothetical protein [Vibrio taketomensis]|uniref:hypothetical protein n=1 Tax=Vibrio taketomensis TaxID=2572923 RepID=UPI00138A4916|nr:hypothetical protein [Vibrio taketomensis]
MTIIEVKNLASAFQSIALVLAICIGGGWALFQFFSVRTIEKAKAELRKLQLETRSHGILQISVTSRAISSYPGTVIVDIHMKNIGTNAETIDLEKSKVTLGPVGTGNFNALSVKATVNAMHQGVDNVLVFTILHPGEEQIIKYIATGLSHSTYLVQASFVGSPSETEYQSNIAKQSGLTSSQVIWGCTEYIEI